MMSRLTRREPTSTGATAANVVEEELGELHDLGLVAAAMAAVLHPPEYVVKVLDAYGSPLGKMSPALPLPADIRSFAGATRTLAAAEGTEWRVTIRASAAEGVALKYTPPGGSIDVSLTNADVEVVLRVADIGPGIPDEDRERVFERFVRLDPARGAGGAGLGLAIARWVAEAHSGRLQLVSSGSGGSVFAVSLPA